ncbi:Trk system potassium transporter TrkA [Alphaproteobacteria bacterium]|nr:Trk system potassium transporter TrkA [Alphaproteobacteria bacterium]
MKSIICGAGDVGYSIADKLSKEGIEVTVLDESIDKLRIISENLDVKTILGLPSLPSTLSNAGARDCDILIAVTKSDETNMVCCQIAHTLFNIPKKIARIRHQDYLKPEHLKLYDNKNLPIDAIISPEEEIAKALYRRIKSPGTVDMLELAKNRLKLVGLKCESNSKILGKSLRDLSIEFKDYLANILFVFRGEDKFIVNSNTKLEKNDLVYMVVDNNNFVEVVREFGHEEAQAQKIVIIGGGNIGYSLSKTIENSEYKIATNIIEHNKERSNFLGANLKTVNVTNGDGLDNKILEEVDISEADYLIAVTDDDEVNILSSLLAKRAGAENCITLINNGSYSSLLNNIGIDLTIDPKLITISKILEKVRRGLIRSDYTIAEGFGEVIEAEILENSSFENKNIEEINLPKSIRVGAILRGDNIMIPNSETTFKRDDDVVFFSETKSIKHLEKLLSIK